MLMYDVGIASLVSRDAAALGAVARMLGRPEAAALEARAARMAQLVATHLWDESSRAYLNRLPTGGFVRRVTPTSFYPLLTRAPTDERVAAMVSGWLTNRTRFCVRPALPAAPGTPHLPLDYSDGGVPPKPGCYWALPSVAAEDAAFKSVGSYWRGLVWGPMVLITYWGLAEYDHLPAVRTARRGLAQQSARLMLAHWRRARHICENYSPDPTATDECTGMRFYHWGALLGYVAIVEAGH
jgi:hypothetical protein